MAFLQYWIMWAQLSDSKNTFSPNSSNQNDFFKKIGWYTFFLLYMWAKYELIWSDITAQTVTLGANLLVMAQTIPQNAQSAIFFWSKWLLGWNNWRRDAGWKFEMRGGRGDQNSEKHLKIYKVVKLQKCPLKT